MLSYHYKILSKIICSYNYIISHLRFDIYEEHVVECENLLFIFLFRYNFILINLNLSYSINFCIIKLPMFWKSIMLF